MSEHAGQEETALIEKLLGLAEMRVTLSEFSAAPLHDSEVIQGAPTSERLELAAQHELERRLLRIRHLPAEICTDLGWRMLLDLFVCNQRKVKIPTQGSGNRWGVSAATAVRQMAALIETGLACRVMTNGDVGQSYLILTSKGHEGVAKVLESYP